MSVSVASEGATTQQEFWPTNNNKQYSRQAQEDFAQGGYFVICVLGMYHEYKWTPEVDILKPDPTSTSK